MWLLGFAETVVIEQIPGLCEQHLLNRGLNLLYSYVISISSTEDLACFVMYAIKDPQSHNKRRECMTLVNLLSFPTIKVPSEWYPL